jgi:hypothetical protein
MTMTRDKRAARWLKKAGLPKKSFKRGEPRTIEKKHSPPEIKMIQKEVA